MDKEQYAFCWIVDFPMYEIGEESGELEFCHNPFSMPAGGAGDAAEGRAGRDRPADDHGRPVRPRLQRRGAVLRRGAQPRPGDHGQGLQARPPGRGRRQGQVPRHVQRVLLRSAPPRGHRAGRRPHGHAAGGRGLHPRDHPVPDEQKRPGRHDGRPLRARSRRSSSTSCTSGTGADCPARRQAYRLPLFSACPPGRQTRRCSADSPGFAAIPRSADKIRGPRLYEPRPGG
jgi:hypothetical protein